MPSELLNLTTMPELENEPASRGVSEAALLVLAVIWCRDEPWRMGEVLLIPRGSPAPRIWFGRGPAEEQRPKSHLGQQRPGLWLPSPPLLAPSISRYQLELQLAGDEEVLVWNRGRAPLFHNDREVSESRCREGELLQLGRQLLLLCCRRPAALGAQRVAFAPFPFGLADPHGIVGECAAVWQLRQQVAFLANRTGHVFVQGQSGSGKELVVRAIHELSPRGARALVSRNAATFPEALVDAELFGNCKNYPNPGMPERSGLVGEADGSTLFLDEFAELPMPSQAHLLRALDAGEYQRLGESRSRNSDFRLIAATNRGPAAIKHDVLARFGFSVEVPDLKSRREDIPLLVRHILRQEAARGDEVARECFPDGDARCEPTLALALARALLTRDYPANVRELKAELWRALAERELGFAARPPHAADAPRGAAGPTPARVRPSAAPESDGAASAGPVNPSPRSIQAALDESNGSIEATWRALGLRNRFVLLRLIKRHDLEVRKRPAISSERPPKR